MLNYIQVWRYEGGDFAAARTAALDLFDELSALCGPVAIPGVMQDGSGTLDRGAVAAFIDTVFGKADATCADIAKHGGTARWAFDLISARQPTSSRLLGRLAYACRYGTYYVFLSQDLPNAPLRTVSENIVVDLPDRNGDAEQTVPPDAPKRRAGER